METNIILISISKDELKDLIQQSIAAALNGNSTEGKELLTAKEASKLLGCSRSHLSKCVKSNLISCKRLGKRVYFEKSELINQIKNMRG